MSFVAFLGCDGSGKSAVIQGLANRLEAEGVSISLGHWRPKPFASPSTTAQAADNPHGQSPRGLASSLMKLTWLWLNWWVAWLSGTGRSAREGMLLFDRYHADLLVDPRRYRYGGPMIFARLASRLMPQPEHVIYLDASADVLLSRKQEVDRATLEKSRSAYHHLCRTHPRFKIVDASRPLDEVVSDVFQIVRLR